MKSVDRKGVFGLPLNPIESQFKVDLIVIDRALSVRSIESSGLDSADCYNWFDIVERAFPSSEK